MTETESLLRHQVVEFATQFKHDDVKIADVSGLYLTEFNKESKEYILSIQMSLMGRQKVYWPVDFHIDFGDEGNGHTERIQCNKSNCFQYLFKDSIRDVERGKTHELPTRKSINLAWP